MTTLELLRETLDADARSAAAPDRVAAVRDQVLAPSAPRRARTPVRTARAGLAFVAAAVVAGLVVSLFVASHGTAPTPAAEPAGAFPVTSYVFTVAPDPGGAVFGYEVASADAQGGYWRGIGTKTMSADPDFAVAGLSVFAPTASGDHLTRPADATDVEVGGTTGWTALWTMDDVGKLAVGVGPGPIVVWTDPATGWQLAAQGSDLELSTVVRLAETVRTATPHPVRSPIRLAWVPEGADLDSSSGSSALGPIFSTSFGEGASGFRVTVLRHGELTTEGAELFGVATPVSVGRFHGVHASDTPTTVVTDGVVDVLIMYGLIPQGAPPAQVESEGPLRGPAMPLDTLTRLLEGMTVADLGDPSSWFDLASWIGR